MKNKAKAKANPKNLKKTTAKGAYKKTSKKNVNTKLRPMVETKKRLQSVIATSLVDPDGIPNGLLSDQMDSGAMAKTYVIHLPWSFISQNQGVTNSEMIGTNLYSRYLKQKYEFTFDLSTTASTSGIQGIASSFYLVHGWCTVPMNKTQYTTPSQGTIVRSDYVSHEEEQVKQYFNQSTDPLAFESKVKTGIKIEGYRRIKAKERQTSLPYGAVYDSEALEITSYGAHEPIYMSCNWTTKRKVHYSPGVPSTSTPDSSFFNPNWSWIPFSMIYAPHIQSLPGSASILFKYDNCHYFSDQ
jgi:hypothetical protein